MNSLKNLRRNCFFHIFRIPSNGLPKFNHYATLLVTNESPKILKFSVRTEVFPRRFFSDFPPHQVIKLPNLSPTMETGNIVSWAINEGDEVNEGDLLAEIETDKATMALDASENGFLAKILIQKGAEGIPVGTPLCVIVEDKESASKFADYKATDEPSQSSSKPDKKTESAPSIPPPAAVAPFTSQSSTQAKTTLPTSSDKPFITPLARRLAEEQGISIDSSAKGSGYLNSITSMDLTRIAATAPTQPAMSLAGSDPSVSFVDISLSNMRSTIAKRLLESKQTIPHYYLTVDINMDEILLLRKSMNAKLKKEDITSSFKISLNDIFIKAASVACMKVPECNSSFQGSFIRQYNQVDMCVAVATRNGLITPIIPSAQSKSFLEISEMTKSLAQKAKDNALKPHEFQGGTFTISNLGMLGIDNFSAIINPPQACILAVGNIVSRLVPDSESERGYKESNYMSVTLCCDHRVVDGAVGAQWLKHFREMIEEPALMLM